MVRVVTSSTFMFINRPIFFTTGRLCFRPYIKPTAQKVPLSASSIHDPSIHSAWPQAEIKRLFNRACTRRDFHIAKKTLAARFAYFFISPAMVGLVTQWHSTMHSRVISDGDSQKLWIPVPYHPQVFEALRSCLRNTLTSWVSGGFWLPFRPSLCWSTSGANLGQVMKQNLDKQSEEIEGWWRVNSFFSVQ